MSSGEGLGIRPGGDMPRSSITVRELAERTGLTEQAVEQALDDLAADGYDMRAPEGDGTFIVPPLPPRGH